MDNTEHELTYGEKAISLSFNPSQNNNVKEIKKHFAALIDHLNDMRENTDNGEVKRMCAVSITELQTAQMWAVKAATWQY